MLLFMIPKSHKHNTWKTYKLSMLPPIRVKVLTQHKCYKFPCSEVLTYIEVFVNGHTTPPPHLPKYVTIWFRMVIIFLSCSLIFIPTHVFLVSILGATPNCIQLEYRCPIKISSHIRHVYLTSKFLIHPT